MTVHEFKSSLKLSQEFEDKDWWELVYKEAFPGFHSMMSVRKDGWAQRGGIDRVIQLSSGKTYTVDEKVRLTSYGDILLERWSSKEKQTPGWVQKSLACDFIAYAFVPDEKVYVLPFNSLQRAWIENGKQWIDLATSQSDGFKVVLAKNQGYTTESIAVPIPTLLSAVAQAQIVKWAQQ